MSIIKDELGPPPFLPLELYKPLFRWSALAIFTKNNVSFISRIV